MVLFCLIFVKVLKKGICGKSLSYLIQQEQPSDCSEVDIEHALIGQIQGFWIGFITMTTVG